jgi:hypothetical protein
MNLSANSHFMGDREGEPSFGASPQVVTEMSERDARRHSPSERLSSTGDHLSGGQQ